MLGFKSEPERSSKNRGGRKTAMTCARSTTNGSHCQRAPQRAIMTAIHCTIRAYVRRVCVRLCQRSRHCLPMRPGRCDAIRDLHARTDRAATVTEGCACISMRCSAQDSLAPTSLPQWCDCMALLDRVCTDHFCGPCSATSATTFASSSAVHGPLTNFGSSTFCQLDAHTKQSQTQAI